jgi:hypothetical protein
LQGRLEAVRSAASCRAARIGREVWPLGRFPRSGDATMLDHDRTTSETDGDSSDVVEGPVGYAHLVDPTAAEGRGADLEALSIVDGPEGIGDAGAQPLEPAETPGL